MLLLAEQLFLLSIDPKTNKAYGRASSKLPYSLSGALLAELMLEGQVEMHRSKIEIVYTEVEDPLLKETLMMIQQKSKKRQNTGFLLWNVHTKISPVKSLLNWTKLM